MTLAATIAVDTRTEKGIKKPRPTPSKVAAWCRRREARRQAADLAALGLGQRSARVLAGQAKCGQVAPYGVAVSRAVLPSRLAARDLLGWVATAYKWREALRGSAAALGELLGVSERTAHSTAADLVAAGWLERYRRTVTCAGTDARCPRCHGAGPQHDRELANVYAPGPRLLAALRDAKAASEARQRMAGALGRRVRRQAAPAPAYVSRSATVADRRLEPENERPGWTAAERVHPHPDQIAPPVGVASRVPSARTPDPEAFRDDCDRPTVTADELAANLSAALRAVQVGPDLPAMRLRIPRPERPSYKRPAQSANETPCAALLAPGLYGPGGPFEGACACPRCSPATDGAARREGRPS